MLPEGRRETWTSQILLGPGPWASAMSPRHFPPSVNTRRPADACLAPPTGVRVGARGRGAGRDSGARGGRRRPSLGRRLLQGGRTRDGRGGGGRQSRRPWCAAFMHATTSQTLAHLDTYMHTHACALSIRSRAGSANLARDGRARNGVGPRWGRPPWVRLMHALGTGLATACRLAPRNAPIFRSVA